MPTRSIISLLGLLCAPACALQLATPARSPLATSRTAVPSMGLFDGLKGAFANDDTLGKRENAGLSKEKDKRTVTWVSPKGQQKKALAIGGQRMKDIARASGIPVVYDCQEGTCKTCEATVNGQRMKLCVGKMPDKDVTVKYNIRYK